MAKAKTEIDKIKAEELAEVFCTKEEIASILKCSVKALERKCGKEIERGYNKAKAELRKKQWQTVLDGGSSMQVWFGKQFLGQSDKIENNINEEQFKELLATAHATMVHLAGAGRATSGNTKIQK